MLTGNRMKILNMDDALAVEDFGGSGRPLRANVLPLGLTGLAVGRP